MAKRRLVRVYLSVTTLDASLARKMEPRAATPARRLQAIAELTRAGVPAGVMVAPMIPGLNDAEMEKILEASSRAGARHAAYILLRLPHELRQMFEDWLATHFPDRAKHVLNLIRETLHDRWWPYPYQARLAERTVHAAALDAVPAATTATRSSRATSCAYSTPTPISRIPTATTSSGPRARSSARTSSPFWLLQLCVALESAGDRW